MVVTEVKKKVSINILPHAITRNRAVVFCLFGQVYLGKERGHSKKFVGKIYNKFFPKMHPHLKDFSLVVPQEGNSVIVLHIDCHSGEKALGFPHWICLKGKFWPACQRRWKKVCTTFVLI